MRTRIQKTIDRAIIRALAARRGQAQAIRDVSYVREVLRVSLIFVLFVLVPMGLLATFALRSLEAELISIDAGLAARATATAERVSQDLERTFRDFEREAADGVTAGDLAVEHLYDTHPALRAVFRFDTDGELGWPWAAPGPDDTFPEPPASWASAISAGERLESRQQPAEAARVFERASHTRVPAHAAAARFAMARAMLRAGSPNAINELVLLADRYPHQRDEHGFRVADLATELRGEHEIEHGDVAHGVQLLRGFVESILARPWSVSHPGDAFVAHRAIDALHGHTDRRWWQAATEDLADRTHRAWWADRISDELTLVSRRAAPEGDFTYIPGARALWVLHPTPSDLWAFSFDYESLKGDLEARVIDPLDDLDPVLSVTLVRTDESMGGALVRRELAPWLPTTGVSISPRDPAALDNQKWWTRTQRLLVIALSVIAGTLGVFAVAQIVKQELDSARLKADFAANVSHELRSPITQIRLKAESLQLGLCLDEADERAHFDAIVAESERLSRLVDNVLDFASIERGTKRYYLRAGDLADVLRKSVESMRDTAIHDADFEVEINIPDDLPVVWMDRDAIGQVATNLLSNAKKYGSEGRWVGLAAGQRDDHAWFSVSDRGMGIAPRDVEKVFEHYYRVDTPEVRKRRGTGIGLTIVRYIVEAHRGLITVDSTVGKGTTFTVSLPLTAPPEEGGP